MRRHWRGRGRLEVGNTRIEWTDVTWNPVRGTQGRWHCTPVSEGCRNCYAERLNLRWGGPAYKPGLDTFRLDKKILEQPLHWKQPRKIFGCDMTDLFHEDIPREWLKAINGVTVDCPQHTFQFLTKRPTRMLEFCEACPFPPNVWLGVSIEDQQTAAARIPILTQISCAIRFVSFEPLLGPITLISPTGTLWPYLHWAILGGESGPHARPCNIEWIRSLVQQCHAARRACFVKQDAGPRPGMKGRIPDDLWQVKEWPDTTGARQGETR